MTGNSRVERNDLEPSELEQYENQDREQDEEDGSTLHPKAVEYVKSLMREKIALDRLEFPLAVQLIEKEIEKIQQVGRAPPKENKYIDILKDWPIKVSSKVLVPIKQFPRFNFVGKLLGPKGNSLKRLQEDTMCRITVMGRGSMRDPQREEELRNSLEPKYGHLSDALNVEISALAPPAEAHARMSYALAEIKKFLIPDKTDDISLQQMEEMEKLTGQKPSFRLGGFPIAGRYDMTGIKKPRFSNDQSRFGGPKQGGYDSPMDQDNFRPNPRGPGPSSMGSKPQFKGPGNFGFGKNYARPGPVPPSSWKTSADSAGSPESARFRTTPYTPYTRRT